MKYTDEQLSAFLDAELSEQDMMSILQKLNSDTALAVKLAKLAAVQAVVDKHSKQPDDSPNSGTVQRLATAQQPAGSNVVQLNLPSRPKESQGRTLAFATAAALVGGLALAQLLPSSVSGELVPRRDVVTVLNSKPSGIHYALADNSQLYPQLTFLNKEQQFCRQYELQQDGQRLQQVACRTGQGWTLAATVKLPLNSTNTGYQPASGGSLLDNYVDSIIHGQVASAEQELNLINSAWSVELTRR